MVPTENSIHLGAEDSEEEGAWRWYDGSPWTWDNWRAGEPNGETAANCLQMYSGGKWDDFYCTARNRFVCQVQVRYF